MQESESEVTQSCPTLSDPMNYSLPGSSVHGIFQARVLEWGAIAFSEFFRHLELNPYSRNHRTSVLGKPLKKSWKRSATSWELGILCLFFFLMYLFFNWRIIALQNFVVFCQTSTWISHSCFFALFPSWFLLELFVRPCHIPSFSQPEWVLLLNELSAWPKGRLHVGGGAQGCSLDRIHS